MKVNPLLYPLLITVSMAPVVLLSGCIPMAAMGGAAGVGAAAVSEKGVGGSVSDTQIATKVKSKIYARDPELHQITGVEVQNGEVLLTGRAPTEEDHLAILKMCWEVEGVKRVIDNIAVSKEEGKFSDVAADAAITTRIKTSTIFAQDLYSLNYSIKTVGRVVYIMGIAQSKEELARVVDIAKTTPNVKRVVSYVRIKGEPTL